VLRQRSQLRPRLLLPAAVEQHRQVPGQLLPNRMMMLSVMQGQR
jgi:hypothetical protein